MTKGRYSMNLNKKITAFTLVLLLLVSVCAALPYGSLSAQAVNTSARPTLIPGGMPFGVKFFIDGVMVVGVTDVDTSSGMASPARDAGIMAGDVIMKINGSEVDGVEELSDLIRDSGGKPVTMELKRDGKVVTAVVTPVKTVDGDYRTGLWIKDSTAGIGTITYIDPSKDTFGGLGHGICDSETGELLPLRRGVVVDVNINGVVKGRVNEPGELKGMFSNVRRGSLSNNTECGVFGTINTSGMELAAPIEIGYRDEVRPGRACIITCAVGEPRYYEAEIERITDKDGKTKNFVIKVTDKQLLETTGGIVQGMSGSPVIQNGRIIGAVTHVMINDPTRGYGIFIENMLEESVSESAVTGMAA